MEGLLSALMTYPTLIFSILTLILSMLFLFAKRKTLKKEIKIMLIILMIISGAILLFLAFAAFAFGKNSHPPAKPQASLEIYLVSSKLPSTQEGEVNINELTLGETPIITIDDIQSFYWDKQVFVTKEGLIAERLNAVGAEQVPLTGLPYVLVVNGERVYMGKFWTMISSAFPYRPSIMAEGMGNIDEGQFDLQPGQQLYAVYWGDEKGNTAEKQRLEMLVFDERIYTVLRQKGLLKE